jgi:hypothetical protein
LQDHNRVARDPPESTAPAELPRGELFQDLPAHEPAKTEMRLRPTLPLRCAGGPAAGADCAGQVRVVSARLFSNYRWPKDPRPEHTVFSGLKNLDQLDFALSKLANSERPLNFVTHCSIRPPSLIYINTFAQKDHIVIFDHRIPVATARSWLILI